MPKPNKPGASALKTALNHVALGVTCLAAIGGIAAGVVSFTGDETAGSPRTHVGLFAERDAESPVLKARLNDASVKHYAQKTHASSQAYDADYTAHEPTLPVSEPGKIDQRAHEKNNDADEVRVTRISHADDHTERKALARAPIPGLHEAGPVGRLPKIGSDGTRPAEAYARPHKSGDKPQIALIVGGLGIKRSLTTQAINDLPPEVTLSFVPYSRDLQTWVNKARAAGHEVLLELPMEPYDYPNVDTGPDTLLTNLTIEENERRLKVLLGQTTGYFGVINYQGAKLATASRVLEPILESINNRGLAFVYDGGASRSVFPSVAKEVGVNFVEADRIVDTLPSADAIDKNLLHLEALAIQNGQALGVGFAFPVTVDQFKQWSETLEMKGYELVPASIVAGIDASNETNGGNIEAAYR